MVSLPKMPSWYESILNVPYLFSLSSLKLSVLYANWIYTREQATHTVIPTSWNFLHSFNSTVMTFEEQIISS